MSTDAHIIAQFTTLNSRLDNIDNSIQGTNRELGKVQGVQKSQWGAIKRVEKEMKTITEHYDNCPAFSELELLKKSVTNLEGKTPSKAPAAYSKIDWKSVFTTGNVKLFLLLLLMCVIVVAVMLGVSIPAGLVGG